MTQLRVYAPIVIDHPTSPVSRAMYDAFQASLLFQLRVCRVSATMSSSEPPPVASAGGPDAAPTSVLMIRADRRQFVEVRNWRTGETLGYAGTLYFGLDLSEPPSHQPVWSARASYKFPSGGGESEFYGSLFARGIVIQLRRDGVLTSCVREPLFECLADRQEQLYRAERITEERERFLALKRVPECR